MITRIFAAAVVAAALTMPSAWADDINQVKDAKSCAAQLKDVKDAQKEGTDVGEKDAQAVAQITEVIESLCGRKNWKDASALLEVARSMMATE